LLARWAGKGASIANENWQEAPLISERDYFTRGKKACRHFKSDYLCQQIKKTKGDKHGQPARN
jgi:hypothetical protein